MESSAHLYLDVVDRDLGTGSRQNNEHPAITLHIALWFSNILNEPIKFCITDELIGLDLVEIFFRLFQAFSFLPYQDSNDMAFCSNVF